MSITVHVAPHPDLLVARLCDELAQVPADLFTREVVVVPTRGIERWLTQRIALEFDARGAVDGICANVEFPSPRQLVRDVLLAVPDLAASVRAWEGHQLTGHITEAMQQCLDEPWMAVLARYLESSQVAGANRLSAARKISRLYRSYARRRPAMIRAWAAGDDAGPDDIVLDDADLWQSRLWRHVHANAGQPALPELLPDGLEPLRSGDIHLDLPERLAVYGLTALDPFELDVLSALAEQRDVRLYVLHPSPWLWSSAEALTTDTITERADDPTADLATHPLLHLWARDSRELQQVLAAGGLTGATTATDEPEPTTLLQQLQADIRTNSPATQTEPDRSVQIHVAHGDPRQVQVLRDAILHLLKEDPTLEPRDIVVMTPDLATFAPLLEAAFPKGDDDLPDLRLRVADRSPAATNALVRFTAKLLTLADGRFEAEVVRELVAQAVVQRRFRFDTETAGELTRLIDDANIAWGLDGVERVEWGAGTNDQRTWRRGLDRALAGVFFADDDVRTVAGTAPMGGIEGGDAVVAGLLAQLVDRLVAIRTILTTPKLMSQWPAAIAGSVRLLAETPWGDEWQWEQLDRLLADTFPPPDEPDDPDPEITLHEVRSAAASWLDDNPSPLHFRTGNVTLCTLAPMRSVPYRVVCLLGMDESRFPRRGRSDGDDLLSRHELVGDHDRSAEDRQLLLDAVMAAGQHLLVTYSGRDQLTNAELAPSVPVAELVDTLEEMVGTDRVCELRTTHPLQAFSDDNFVDGELGVNGPWSFDPMQLNGALSVRHRPVDQDHLPPWPDFEPIDPVRLDDLIAFLEHPAKAFVRTRLGFTFPQASDMADDTLPADLGGLDRWGVKEGMLDGLRARHGYEQIAEATWARDLLPPGYLGEDDLDRALDEVQILWEAARERGYDPQAMVPVTGVIDVNGRTLEGTVTADIDQGHRIVVRPARLKAKHRLRSFTELAFLSAVRPDVEWTGVLIGHHTKKGKHLVVTGNCFGDTPDRRRSVALTVLADLIDLFDLGMAEPMALPCQTAYAWRRALYERDDFIARLRAEDAWETDKFAPECKEPEHSLLFGGTIDTDTLLQTDMPALAERLWLPILLGCQEVEL